MTSAYQNNEQPLRMQAENYIAFKKASGCKAHKLEMIINRFVSYAEQWEPGCTTISKDTAEKWATMSPEESPRNQQVRMNSVQNFARYLVSHGINAYIYPRIRWESSNFKPYIFSDDELARFFDACDNTKTPNLIRSDVVSLIFRIIYACGLRASEAVNLTNRDVDLVQGTIYIKNAKFNKERLLPISEALLIRVKKYHNKVLTLAGPDAPFFPNGNGKFYTPGSLYAIFRERLRAAGISHGGKNNGPRLHDLRHTFAVHCLRRAVRSGDDISVMMKYISVYLGHTGIPSSENYLRLTADLYPDIVCKMEKEFDVLPSLEEFLNEDD